MKFLIGQVTRKLSDKQLLHFEVTDITVKGNMRFTHIEFLCPVCQKYYTVKETRENDFLIERWK